MKKALAFLFILLSSNYFFAQAAASDEEEGLATTIVLPDINLTIKDESEIPLQDTTEIILEDEQENFARVNLEELSSSDITSAILGDILFEDELTASASSLSSFAISYGLYENLNIEFNLGKSYGDLNYLINYQRNSHKNLGYQTNSYLNTSYELDDLNLEFLTVLGEKWNVDFWLRYLDEARGLYSNTVNIAEGMQSVPMGLDFDYFLSSQATLGLGLTYYNLLLDHTTSSSYDRVALHEIEVSGDLKVDWSKDNYIKLNTAYQFCYYDENPYHYFSLFGTDRLPLTENLSLEVGGALFFSGGSGLEFFWYPKADLILKAGSLFKFTLSADGAQSSFGVSEYLNETQIAYTNVLPEEVWLYEVAVTFKPLNVVTLKISGAYNNYQKFQNFSYNNSSELYSAEIRSNVNLVDVTATLDFLIAESLSVLVEYQYNYLLSTNDTMLFFPKNSAEVSLDYQNSDWGLRLSSSFTYEDIQNTLDSVLLDPRLIWDFEIAKSVSEVVYLEAGFDNILNTPDFESLAVPNGGFTFSLGTEIFF